MVVWKLFKDYNRKVGTLLVVLTCLLCLLFMNTIHRNILLLRNSQLPQRIEEFLQQRQENVTPKVILMYNPLYWWEDWVDGTWETSDVFRQCPISNCIISKNLSLFNTSDAVIFKLQTFNELPRPKRKGHVWIFAQFEPPPIIHYPSIFRYYMNLVNWTLSYRRDSDLSVVHGQFRKLRKPSISLNEISKKRNTKKKMAVIFNSHCNTQSKRETYLLLLNDTLRDIDEYGYCGRLKCGGMNRFTDAWNMKNKTTQEHDHCFSLLDTKYKFYLSFENSLCRDYITEKGLNMVYRRDIIPVVWGGANYSMYLPPLSYIDTFSPTMSYHKKVASLLKHLNLHEDHYNRYFDWRRHYESIGMLDSWNENFCKMCARLQTPEKYRRLYTDIYGWIYHGGKSSTCTNPVM